MPDAGPSPGASSGAAAGPAGRLTLSRLDSPIGPLGLATDAAGVVRGAAFSNETGGGGGDVGGLRSAMARTWPGWGMAEGAAPAAVAALLAAYFGGDRDALARIPWSLDGARSAAGGDDGFQPRVWRALADIPVGTAITYGEMARRAGEPGAAQAAGVALNRNPIPLVLACHRVVGAANASGGWAMVGFGGGVERKSWLLRHEGALLL